MSSISISFRPFTLDLKHQFTVSSYSRVTTPIMLVEINHEGFTGYGEASMPPYLGESQESATRFLSKINFSRFKSFQLDEILDYIDSIDVGNNAAKASVDIALHDIQGKLLGKPLHKIWDLDPLKAPLTSFTIGIDDHAKLIQKVKEVEGFEILKIKLGSSSDKEMVKAVRSVTSLPLMADVNQGWNSKEYALEMAYWLKDQNVILLEQPLSKENIDDLAWLSERSPIPIIADEGIKRMDDLQKNLGAYNGVNVKLMKSAGLREAKKMLEFSKNHNMIPMIGCMTETSCAVAAASHLSPLCNFADLDGPFLIKNNPFEELSIKNGTIVIPSKPGIGVDIIQIII